MPSFNDDHLGFSGPELNGVNAINITAAGGKPFSLHNAVSFQSTATMAHLPVDDTVTRAVGVDGSGNLVNTNKVASGDLTALTATVNTKADTSTVTALTSTVATKASVTSVATKASSVEVDALADTVADKADTSTVTALTATVGTKADTSTVTALTTTVGTKANTSTVTALTTTVGTKADDSVVVKTSGDQSIGGQKTWTGAQINTGGLYGFGTVSFQGTSSKAVTIQSSNPGGGVNSELRLVTANTTDASNVTYNTGVLKYNSATDTFELDKPLTVTGTIQSTTGMQSPGYNNTVTTQTAQVGSTNGITAAKEFTDTVTFSKTSGTALSCTGAASLRTTTLVAGHDITQTGTSGGLFARLATAEANVVTLNNKIQDLLNHYKGDMIGFSPGERASINFLQSMGSGIPPYASGDSTSDTALGGVLLMYNLLTRSGYQLKAGHVKYDWSTQNNQASNKHLPQPNTWETDHPSSRAGFQEYTTGVWDHDDDDDATDGMCLLDNNLALPGNGNQGFYCRFVFDTWRKRRGTSSSSVYVQGGRDSMWFLHIFKCVGDARFTIRTDGGSANFYVNDIDQDYASGDNQNTAQGKSFKIPFVCSSRYITGTILKPNEDTNSGRLKFGIHHTTYHTEQTTVANTGGVGAYVYDQVDATKQFSLAT